ncbi:hypothetical protein FRC08_005569 [Ceratobasidium sp. 394]|nr:hypothetical protein FRC08_005569 [Ceratobasidium sp. 394]
MMPVFKRALHGFVLLRQGEPDFVQPLVIKESYWADFSVQGYAATLEGEEGLCVQTGYWFDNVVKYQLVKIDRIQALELRSDPAFRNGEPCMWLFADNYRYAMMCPFMFFQDMWALTLAGYLTSPCQPMSLSAHRPIWWPEAAQPAWLRLQRAVLPSVTWNTTINDTWHNPGFPVVSALRSGLVSLAPASNPTIESASAKRACGVHEQSGNVADGTAPRDAERCRPDELMCLEDPHCLERVLGSGPSSGQGVVDGAEPWSSLSSSLIIRAARRLHSWVLGEPATPSAVTVDKINRSPSNAPVHRRFAP